MQTEIMVFNINTIIKNGSTEIMGIEGRNILPTVLTLKKKKRNRKLKYLFKYNIAHSSE